MDNQLFDALTAPVASGQPSGVAPEATSPEQPIINPPRFVPIGASQDDVAQYTSAVEPSSQGAPATPEVQTPSAPQGQPDPTQQRLQQYEQAFNQLQQMAAQAEMQRRQEQEQREFLSRREQIYETAKAFDPDNALAYIRRHEDQEAAALRQENMRIRQEAEQQKMQAVAAVAAPLYAQHLAKSNNLPPEYVERLAMLPPQHMDAYAPVLVREYQAQQEQNRRYQEVLTQLDQMRRTQQASAIVATGAHSVTNATPTPSSGQQYQVEAGSPDHLLALDPRIAAMFGYKQVQ